MEATNKPMLTGLLAIVIPLTSIFLSIALSPWFSWRSNALSDLGHSLRSEVAEIFNAGLLTGGLLLILYGALFVRKVYPLTSVLIGIVGYLFQLVGLFDEAYGFAHLLVSAIFFLSLAIATLVYCYERRSLYPLILLAIGTVSWLGYFLKIYRSGISVPEIVSVLGVAFWYFEMCYRVNLKLSAGDRETNS